jgi:branched-chain amino acid transport system substrate-binding protein
MNAKCTLNNWVFTMNRLVLATLTLVANFMAACSEPERNRSPEIVLGMSAVLSGPAETLGKDMRRGVLAGIERANRAGGVKGRNLRLISLDDGYEPWRTGPNMRQLVEKENVLAIIGNVGTPTAIVAVPIAMEKKTLFFAAYSGAGVLRQNPPERYVINFRASYAEETSAMIDALVDELGVKPEEIALFTQRDGYGDAGFTGSIAALKRHGLKDEKSVVHVRYERNTLAVENAVADLVLVERQPRAVVMVGAYAPCAKFIKLCCESGLRPLFLNVSFVGSNPLAKELAGIDATVIVTQVVPHPLDTTAPIVRDYLADLRAFDPHAVPGFGDLEGYIAARILMSALGTIDGQPTRESIVDALEALGDFDLGLGNRLKLAKDAHQASHSVWPTILANGTFVPLKWAALSEALKKEMK